MKYKIMYVEPNYDIFKDNFVEVTDLMTDQFYWTTVLAINPTMHPIKGVNPLTVGFIRRCDKGNLDVAIFDYIYNGSMWPIAKMKIEEIKSRVLYYLYRLSVLDKNGTFIRCIETSVKY